MLFGEKNGVGGVLILVVMDNSLVLLIAADSESKVIWS